MRFATGRMHEKYKGSAVNLDERFVPQDPFSLFDQWYRRAEYEIKTLPEAFVLSTASTAGKPSSRVVLLKSWGRDGFMFYTNLQSRKGRELRENPVATMLFYWSALGRQIRIEGAAHKVSEEEARAYFLTRPRASQLGAHASEQSSVIASRAVLDAKMKAMEDLYAGADVPKPTHWGGFRIEPEMFEFWQNQEARLHDRLSYKRIGSGEWRCERLAP